jgi:DNA-binding transcriptional MerR regulator
MSSEETKREKLFYSIGEVADMLGVQTSAVRYWEKEFDLLKPRKNRKGNRLFTPADVENLKIIFHLLKVKGMTLAGAKMKMKENPEDLRRSKEVIDSLENIKSMLIEMRDSI